MWPGVQPGLHGQPRLRTEVGAQAARAGPFTASHSAAHTPQAARGRPVPALSPSSPRPPQSFLTKFSLKCLALFWRKPLWRTVEDPPWWSWSPGNCRPPLDVMTHHCSAGVPSQPHTCPVINLKLSSPSFAVWGRALGSSLNLEHDKDTSAPRLNAYLPFLFLQHAPGHNRVCLPPHSASQKVRCWLVHAVSQE